MSPRYLKAIFISIILHASLLTLAIYLASPGRQKADLLVGGGGVVRFNLNSGGLGSGGLGGYGSAEPPLASPEQPEVSEPAPRPLPEPSPDKPKIASQAQKPPLKKNPRPTSPPSSKPKSTTEKPQPTPPEQPALPGPGRGEGEGKYTGPGGGQGEGLGQGQGAGIGEGKGEGGVGKAGRGGEGDGKSGSAVLAKIRSKILRAKRYPRRAQEEKIEGICGIRFELNPDGSVGSLSITKSSGQSILDEESLAAVRRAAPFPYHPRPIAFSLEYKLQK